MTLLPGSSVTMSVLRLNAWSFASFWSISFLSVSIWEPRNVEVLPADA